MSKMLELSNNGFKATTMFQQMIPNTLETNEKNRSPQQRNVVSANT